MSETTETVEQEAPKAPPAELTISDLSAMKNLIEVVSTRGAFKATELTAVGMIFDKLNAFLAAAQQVQAQQGEQQNG
jgi:hypothetical protein